MIPSRSKFETVITFILYAIAVAVVADVNAGGQSLVPPNKETDQQTISNSGGTAVFLDGQGTQSETFELIPSGSPTSYTCTGAGLMRGGTVGPTTSVTGTAAQILQVAGGPFDKWAVQCTWSGGSSPTVLINRTATVSRGTAGPSYPNLFGGVNAPDCVVNGSTRPSLYNCTALFSAGRIDDFQPEYFASTGVGNPLSHFTGRLNLGCDLAGTQADNNHVIAWITDWPIVLQTGADITGCGPVNPATQFAGGTAIVKGPNFFTKLGQPSTLSLSCPASGSLVAGTYDVTAAWIRETNSNGGASTPLPGQVSARATVVCPGSGQIQFASPGANAPATGTAAGGIRFYACLETSGDCHKDAVSQVVGSGLICPGSASALDGNTCDTTAGTVKISTLATNTTAGSSVPPVDLMDYSAPLVVLGTGIAGTLTQLSTWVSDLTLEADSQGNSTPGSTTPTVGLVFNSAQEISGADRVWIHGPFTSAMWVALSGNNNLFRINTGLGANTGTSYCGIIEGRPAGNNNGGNRSIFDMTCAIKAGAAVPAQILVIGSRAAPDLQGIHLENTASQDGLQFDDGGNGTYNVIGGVLGANGGLVHYTATAGNATGYAGVQVVSGFSGNAILDQRFIGPCLGNTAFCDQVTGPANRYIHYLGQFTYANQFFGSNAQVGIASGATYFVGDLGCVTATGSVGDCASGTLNANFLGVLL